MKKLWGWICRAIGALTVGITLLVSFFLFPYLLAVALLVGLVDYLIEKRRRKDL